jgi:hypothetical protein
VKNTPTNHDDVIDSRDVIARIEELESEVSDIEEAEGFDPLLAKQEHAEVYDELATLKSLAEEGGSSPDWSHGETLIRDSYFQNYAQELVDDCYDMKQADSWPFKHIDWGAAANALKADYFSVDFDGVEYWVRG